MEILKHKAMEPRRTKALAVLLGSLLLISATLAWIGRPETRLVVDKDLFAVKETEKINRVLMVRKSDTVDLTFDGSWTVNGKWDADLQMIKVLMAALRQIVPHRPVAASRVDTVNKQLGERGTRVVLSDSDGTEMKLIAGGNSAKSEAWFRKEGEEQPYVVIIPGYRVYVSGIFEMDASGWRNKRIFDFNWRNFKSLTASYAKEPKAGFRVEMKQRYFGIQDMAEVDTTKLNDYLDAVSLLLATRFVTRPEPMADSIVRTSAVARIDIRDIADRIYSLELFAPRKDDDEVFGRLADGQVVAFDRSDVIGIVRRRGWFEVNER